MFLAIMIYMHTDLIGTITEDLLSQILKNLLGAAHATEIPLLTGNNKLVGDYGFLIYPIGGLLKDLHLKYDVDFGLILQKMVNLDCQLMVLDGINIMAKKYSSNYLILDKKRDLKMHTDNFSFSSLIQDLYQENALTNLEKCVVLLQMLTYVGDDLYDDYVDEYPGKCDRNESEQFLKDNADFIDY